MVSQGYVHCECLREKEQEQIRGTTSNLHFFVVIVALQHPYVFQGGRQNTPLGALGNDDSRLVEDLSEVVKLLGEAIAPGLLFGVSLPSSFFAEILLDSLFLGKEIRIGTSIGIGSSTSTCGFLLLQAL